VNLECFTDYSQQFTLSTKICSFTHTPVSLFIKVANSIKGFSELYKSYVQRENKPLAFVEWLAAGAPGPGKVDSGFKHSAESK